MEPRTNVASAFVSMQWAILPEKLEAIRGIVARHELGIKLDADEIVQQLAEVNRSDPGRRIEEEESGPKIAVIPVVDTLMNRASLFDAISGATSYERISQSLQRAADDEEITHIVLDFDTPGGTVNGVEQAAEAIRYASSRKPTIAVVNDMAASAGYWLASQADSIYVSKSSTLGSIGVLYAHIDTTEAEKKLGFKTTVLHSGEDKAIGHSSVPLSKDAEKKIKGRLDITHQLFISSVAAGRGLDEDEVKSLATGFIFNGQEAVKNGLADGYGTLHSVIQAIHSAEPMDESQKETTEKKETAPVSEPATESKPIVQKTEGNVSLDQLAQTVNQLAGVVNTLATTQKSQLEDAAKQKAQALINPLVRSGAVSPVKGEELIVKATENYDLVESLVQSLRPNLEVPYESVVEPGRIRGTSSPVGGESRQVFSMLGLINGNGQFDFSRVTLPLDSNGQITHKLDDVRYKTDRVAPEVQQVMGQLGQWKS